MNIFLVLMLISILFPIIHSFRCKSMWERMLCYTSISTRAAVVLLLVARVSHDAMIGIVAVVVLSVGNSGLLLLANLLKTVESECE